MLVSCFTSHENVLLLFHSRPCRASLDLQDIPTTSYTAPCRRRALFHPILQGSLVFYLHTLRQQDEQMQAEKVTEVSSTITSGERYDAAPVLPIPTAPCDSSFVFDLLHPHSPVHRPRGGWRLSRLSSTSCKFCTPVTLPCWTRTTACSRSRSASCRSSVRSDALRSE